MTTRIHNDDPDAARFPEPTRRAPLGRRLPSSWLGRLAAGALVALPVFIGWAEAHSPKPTETPSSKGPVQGYHGGYDPIDKSKAPAAAEGGKADRGNADEGRGGRTVSGVITAIEGRTLRLDNGLILAVPPTLQVEQDVLAVGTRIFARYERLGDALVVTAISRQSG